MGESKQLPPEYDVGAKWDACLDVGIRRVFYSSLAGAFGGLLFFRSPVTRWASVAFGAGVGIGTAYTECSYKFGGCPMLRVPSKNPPRPTSEPLQLIIMAGPVLEGQDLGYIRLYRKIWLKLGEIYIVMLSFLTSVDFGLSYS